MRRPSIAMPTPNSGVSSWYASWISATSGARSVESCGRDDEDGRVDEERERESDGGIDERVANRFALAGVIRRICASARSTSAGKGCAASRSRRGSQSRCRASLGVSRSRGWEKTVPHTADVRLSDPQLEEEAEAHRGDECEDQRFQKAEAFVLQIENEQNVEGGNKTPHSAGSQTTDSARWRFR